MTDRIVHALFNRETNSLLVTNPGGQESTWYCITFSGPEFVETSDGSKWYRIHQMCREQERFSEQLNEVLQPIGCENLLDAARRLVGYVKQVRMTIEAEHSSEFIEILQPRQDETLAEAALRLAGEATDRERKLQDDNASLEGQIELLEAEMRTFKVAVDSSEYRLVKAQLETRNQQVETLQKQLNNIRAYLEV